MSFALQMRENVQGFDLGGEEKSSDLNIKTAAKSSISAVYEPRLCHSFQFVKNNPNQNQNLVGCQVKVFHSLMNLSWYIVSTFNIKIESNNSHEIYRSMKSCRQ